jgi:hypothetical protein
MKKSMKRENPNSAQEPLPHRIESLAAFFNPTLSRVKDLADTLSMIRAKAVHQAMRLISSSATLLALVGVTAANLVLIAALFAYFIGDRTDRESIASEIELVRSHLLPFESRT